MAGEGELEPFGWGEPLFNGGELARLGAFVPAEFGWPEGRAEHAPGLSVERFFVEFGAELGGIGEGAGIGPGDDIGEGSAGGIAADEAMPEAGEADGFDATDAESGIGAEALEGLFEATEDGALEHSGIDFGASIGVGDEWVGLLGEGIGEANAEGVEEGGASGRSAEIDGEDERGHGD